LPRCAHCATDDPVESPQEVSAHARPVFAVLREAGVPLDPSIYAELLPRERCGPVPENSGVLAMSRTEKGTFGSFKDRIIVAIVAGSPDPLLRRLLAHQLGHAFLLSQGVATCHRG
jgi:hypothetical protein